MPSTLTQKLRSTTTQFELADDGRRNGLSCGDALRSLASPLVADAVVAMRR